MEITLKQLDKFLMDFVRDDFWNYHDTDPMKTLVADEDSYNVYCYLSKNGFTSKIYLENRKKGNPLLFVNWTKNRYKKDYTIRKLKAFLYAKEEAQKEKDRLERKRKYEEEQKRLAEEKAMKAKQPQPAMFNLLTKKKELI